MKRINKNVGIADRVFRIGMAGLIGFFLLFEKVTGILAIIVLLFAVVLLVTSLIGFCPLYSLLGIKTNSKSKPNFKELLAKGATLLDVRTKREFEGGHVSKALNINLNKLSESLAALPRKDEPIIVCCASGARSKSAMRILESKGYTKVYNGGSWINLNYQI